MSQVILGFLDNQKKKELLLEYFALFLCFALYKMDACCCTEEDIEYETINGEDINDTNSEKSISSLHVNNDIELLAISGVVLP